MIPEITVIVPTRDRCEFLSIAITTALRQQDVELEIIVVDDGSRDETRALLARCSDPRLRVLRHPTSLGVSQARNRGLEEARGSWVAFLDDDDVWAPQKLRRQLDEAAAQGASFVFSSMVAFDDRNGFRRLLGAASPEDLPSMILERNVVRAPSALIAKRELVRRVGGFDTSLSTIADWDLWIRLAAAGKAAVCEEPLAGYRLHAGNMQASIGSSELRREYDHLAAKHGIEHRIQADYAYALASLRRRQGRRLAASRFYFSAARSSGDLTHALRGLFVPFGERVMALPGRKRGVPEPEWLHPSRGLR